MIDERKLLGSIFSELPSQCDGRVLIFLSGMAVAFVGWNLVLPTSSHLEKWVTLWLVMPLLLFLIYVRMRQIIHGEALLPHLFRSVFLLIPTVVLFYFNFFSS